MPRKPEFIRPTDDENIGINHGIALAPDSPELTATAFMRTQAAPQAIPSLANARRVRGPQKAPTKALVSMRLDPDLLARLKADEPGWQSRANDILRQTVSL